MIYSYEDDTLTNLIEIAELEELENKALQECETIYQIVDEPYKQKLVVSLVYMNLSKLKLDSEELIEKKYRLYKEEFNRYLNIAKTKNSTPSSLSTGEIQRC